MYNLINKHQDKIFCMKGYAGTHYLRFIFILILLPPLLLGSNKVWGMPQHDQGLYECLRKPYDPTQEKLEERSQKYARLLDQVARGHLIHFDSLARIVEKFANEYALANLKLHLTESRTIYQLFGGDYKRAYDLAKIGILQAKKEKNPSVSESEFLNLIGTIYAHLEDYEQAANTYEEVITITKNKCRGYPDSLCSKTVAYALMNTGTSLGRAGDPEKAFAYYEEALQLCHQLQAQYPDNEDLVYLEATIIGSKGIGNKHIGNFELAERFCIESINTYRRIGEKNNLAVLLQHLGEIYAQRRAYDKAKQAMLESIEIREQANMFTAELAETYNAMADLCLKHNELDDAGDFLQKSIDIGQRNEQHRALSRAYRLRASLDSLNGNYASAYLSLLHFNRHNATQLEEQIAINKKKWEAQQDFEQQVEKEKQVVRRRTSIFILALISMAVIIVLVDLNRQRLMQRNKRFVAEQKELNANLTLKEQEVKFKNQELASLSSRLMERNQFINQLQEELTAGKQDRSIILANLKKKLNLEVQSQADLDQFRVRLDDLNQDYYFRLSQKYPDLTKNERRLCAVVKMGLSTNDIANLAGSSASAIRTRKSRLKKKLGITDQSLEEFLQQT